MPVEAEIEPVDLREAAWASRSSLAADRPGYFLVLCRRENRDIYAPEFARGGVQAVYASTVEELLRYGFMLPPLAIVVDSYTATRIGSERVSGLFNLGVAWPVMRGSISASGEVRVMCLEPAKSGALGDAIAAIASGDPTWNHPRFRRRSLRVDLRARARVRCDSNSPWRQANLLSISVGGAYVVQPDEIPMPGESVEIELLDLSEKPLRVKGRVAWRRTWDEGPELPGFGVEFVPSTVTSELRTAVAQRIAPTIRTNVATAAREPSSTADSVYSMIEAPEAVRELTW